MSANGQLRADELSPIPGGRLAKGDVVRSYLAMRFFIGRKTGVWLRPTGPRASYRTLATQREFYAAYQSGRGALAAVPGTSNHGLGRAVDLPTPAMQAAVREYGHLFGWGIAGGVLKSDAQSEAWHACYRGPYTKFARRWYWRRRLTLRRARR